MIPYNMGKKLHIFPMEEGMIFEKRERKSFKRQEYIALIMGWEVGSSRQGDRSFAKNADFSSFRLIIDRKEKVCFVDLVFNW